jgi:AbrB family looped-hinge helix DNA binding protein
MRIIVGKDGRIVLPKKILEKYNFLEGSRLIVVESMGRICLVPVKIYEKPTEALYGSVKLDKPVEDPRRLAQNYVRKRVESKV